MKKISLIVMSCMIACGLLANHGIVKGGEMSPKVEDTVSIDKKIADSQWLSNNSDTLEVDTAGEDSVVNVVAYFCKGDTCEYWIYENEWKVNGKDTVKTLGVSTQVRLVVNDSTSKGYKMSYTFLDVKADSVGDNFRDKMMAMVAERTAKSVIGTTVNFETDEYGRITKITNLSKIKKQAKALFKASMKDIAAITGQKPVPTYARKSVANFKLRQGMKIGVKVTLRGERMYEFVDRLFNLALPRVRDFKGINPNAFDGRGNYSLGLKEQLLFPEIEYDKVEKIRGMDICFVTTAQNDEEARELLRRMGAPFAKN